MSALLALSAGGAIADVGRSLREAFFMFWETLWPLVLGFGLSGAVQAFVSHEQMERNLPNHRPAAVARAGIFGMVSSSCSYAASAMAKSLFQKGADFTSAMIFMFASTNLVVELGIVLAILMGWQFTVAEFLGGQIMIVLLAVVGGLVLRPDLVEAARRRLGSGRNDTGHDHADMSGVTETRQAELDEEPWRVKLTSKAAWADAASYTMADLTMLRREMVIGYAVAGFLAVLVPNSVWHTVFLSGHGWGTSVENVLVGPVIAFLSFVCSIGNVPMAAALWKGGISFGGVISFIFADLVAAPLVLIYRRYYGGQLTLRLVGLFWAVMAAAGLVVERVFSAADLVPRRRPTQIAATSFHWNYTTFLNIVFIVVFALLYWLYRNRQRLGGGAGYAMDPVCGMQVRISNAPAHRRHAHHEYWFCSDHCASRFDRDPARHGSESSPENANHQRMEESEMAVDPVCGMTVDPATAAAVRTHLGRNYFFCAPGCAEAFEAEPDRYLEGSTPESQP
ncbi:MAG TPA: permease [Acidimicrobiales bacterium]|nr:permease [Acidimicrobiales bacterium]